MDNEGASKRLNMALLNWRAPVDYEAQLQAFSTFLEKFETSRTLSDEAADAIDGLHLDGDHTSDEYDFMDDVAGPNTTETTRNGRRATKRKYMEMLQEVADRDRTNVTIELDDLREVRETIGKMRSLLTVFLVRTITRRRIKS